MDLGLSNKFLLQGDQLLPTYSLNNIPKLPTAQQFSNTLVDGKFKWGNLIQWLKQPLDGLKLKVSDLPKNKLLPNQNQNITQYHQSSPLIGGSSHISERQSPLDVLGGVLDSLSSVNVIGAAGGISVISVVFNFYSCYPVILLLIHWSKH